MSKKKHSVRKDAYWVALLKDCAKTKDLSKGIRAHSEVSKMGLIQKCPHIGSTLINMYAKCGLPFKAQKVFDDLPLRDVVAWNSLISGYIKNGQGLEALSCLEKMRKDRICPNTITLSSLLKACGIAGSLKKGREIHDEIIERNLLGNDMVLGNALIDMYVRFGDFVRAHKVLDELPTRDVVSWSTLISGHTKQGQCEQALTCFHRMRNEGVEPNVVTFTCILKACGCIGDVDKGKEIHDEIARNGLLKKDGMLGNALVDMYARCCMLLKARQVLDELPSRDVVSWNALIVGYVQQGQAEDAINSFEHMTREGIFPNAVTFLGILQACGSTGALDKGKQIHNEIVDKGFLAKDIMLGTTLVDMYAKCGALAKARQVFDELSERNTVSWSVIISGYTQHGHGEEALKCFEQMQREGLSANVVIFTCVLKACGITKAIDKGIEIHEKIVKKGWLGKDIMLGNALADMYVKCGELTKARKVLFELPERDVVSWSILISGLTQHGHGEETLFAFEQMKREGVSPNPVTFACILKACSSIGAVEEGKEVHEEIVKRGLLENDVVLGTALVDMYAKIGELAKAHELLDNMPVRNVVSWSALITGYSQQGQGEEALKCFDKMQHEGLSPNGITLSCILSACGGAGAIEKGEMIHRDIVEKGLLAKDGVLGNAVVDMYAKCGELAKAQKVLDELPVRVAISWNALISGYAQRGKGIEALNCFEKMQKDEVSPSGVTFLSVLNACSHAGLVNEAQLYFDNMTEKYGITPDLEHYTCMVDLFGRAGHFDKAMALLKKMPFSDYPPIWGALLSACQKNGNVTLGRLAFEHAIQLDSSNSTAYIAMANIYAAAGMHKEAAKIEAMMRAQNSEKDLHRVWIDVGGSSSFCTWDDAKHPQGKDICSKLKELSHRMLHAGYSSISRWMLMNTHRVKVPDTDETNTNNVVCAHNEKLAIAYALINIPQGSTIHVVKKMGTCRDCHIATSLISKLEKRKIVVRDANCIHVFEDGKCSCGDH